jgi:anaerobic selenocysteine-containing dehydrogenase
VPIIIVNPLRERGFERFTNPHSTQISSQYHQITVGGDKAALIGVCKGLFEIDDSERAKGQPGVIDRTFIAENTHGFGSFGTRVDGCGCFYGRPAQAEPISSSAQG